MNLSDLQLTVQIIDLAAERGLFKGADLKTVGEVRERMIAFIQANSKPAEGTPNDTTSDVTK